MGKCESLVLVLLLFGGLACTNADISTAEGRTKMIEKMSVEDKVGQLFMIGFNEKEVSPFFRSWIVDRKVGGVILFRKNIESETQLVRLTSEMQNLAVDSGAGLPLFISIDQELGKRSSMIHFAGIPPEPAEVARMRGEQVSELASTIASNLAGWGINTNLAPVVDVDRAEGGIPLSYRTFSADPDSVAYFASIFVREFGKQGVMATAKHFPGLGNVEMDSHRDLPVTDKSLEQMMEHELIPYIAVIEENVPLIMSAHILVPALDSVYPATLSRNILTGLLRDSLGFEGIIITDAMQMGGISRHYPVDEACVMAINAGADIILHCQFKKRMATAPECYARVVDAVKTGEISRERLDEAVARVLELKGRYLINR
ncbi:hypothetical protein GF359_09050 [candidate division WOR-3 bacterium]|uniref:Glycoside hydrolase family 3 N-terminal domain-containing protein n=1 Tax=candidate division WOR-3 bacterium TaxID=2052148 RepID=A0A9D5KAX3_UNCW3|nr:hypothetical protein [candidate division WOR-3 bacterium]MBD3365345.1 hypothetical protein [candidate division WOR-3 bacterium]